MRTPTWKSDIGDVTTAIRKYCNYHLPSGAESATVLNVKKIKGSEPCWVADVEYSYGYQNGEKMTTIQQEEFPCDSEIFMYSSKKNEMNSKSIKSSNDNSKLYTVEEFVDLISADYYDKEDFIDWVKEGIHGHDKLSADRWMEQWRERESMFTNSEDSTNEDEFIVYTDDKEITVRKMDDNKWHGSDGKIFMGYLKPQDVLHWYRQDYGKAWIDSSRQIKSSPNFKEFTADEIFDTFDTDELTDTVFMDREQCKANKCGMDEFTELMWNVAPTWLGIHNPDDVREVCRRAKNPKAKAFLEAFETALENAKFTDRFYDSIKIHKKGEIASSKSQEEFEDLVIDIENRLGVNVEHSNIFNLPAELTYEDECYIDDICREQNCRFVPVNGSRRKYRLIQSSRRNNMIKSAHTRPDSERFDEYGYFNPYTPTEEELAKKDEIKKVLSEELSKAYEPDPMDDYAGYDSTNERIDMACERVAKQFNVDTDFVDELAGEVQKEANEMNFKEWEWVNTPGNLTSEQYEQYMNGELDVRPLMLKNSRQIKSSYEDAFTVSPWDTNQVTGTSDEDLGLSYVVEAYGNEFVNVDDETLNDIRDEVLLRYFDDDAYVRDWNINYPDNQIESIYDIEDPEDLNNEELARYFDYEAYGRDLRLEYNMVWDSEEECWVSAHDVDDSELDNDKYIFMRG